LEELLEQHPSIAVMMTRELGRRLERKNKLPEEREENNMVAAIGTETPRSRDTWLNYRRRSLRA